MSILRISDLETAASVTGDEFVIIDNSFTTKKTTIKTLVDAISSGNTEEFIDLKTTVQTNSASWNSSSSEELSDLKTTVQTSSASWNSVYTTVCAASASWGVPSINIANVSGLTYTLQLSDAGAYIRKSHDSPHSITVPHNDTTEYTIGTSIVIRNACSNVLTISGASGVDLSYFEDLSANIVDPNSSAQIIYIGTNNWDIV
jgi:hypothetical protein